MPFEELGRLSDGGDDLVVNELTVLGVIRSPNYVADTSGWIIRGDGTAEFTGLEITGDVQSSNYVLDTSGYFLDYDTGSAEFNDVTVRGDLQSSNYVANTTGYLLDYSTGDAEFNGTVSVGGDIIMSGGDFRTNTVSTYPQVLIDTGATSGRIQFFPINFDSGSGWPNFGGYVEVVADGIGTSSLSLISPSFTGNRFAEFHITGNDGTSENSIGMQANEIYMSSDTGTADTEFNLRGFLNFNVNAAVAAPAGLYGMYRDNSELYIETAGTVRLTINSTGITSTEPFLAPLGTSQGFMFNGDSDTGVIRSAANHLSFQVGGTTYSTLNSNDWYNASTATGSYVLTNAAGAAGKPTYTFTNDTDTGMYRSNTNNLSFATAGAERLLIGTSTVQPKQQLRVINGTDAVPSISFSSGTTTGLRLAGANNEILMVCGGVGRMAATTSDFIPWADNSFGLGRSGRRWTDVWAVDTTINSSDQNDKTNIGTLPFPATAAVNALEPKRFKWVGRDRWHFGFIAQEVKAMMDARGVDWGAFIDPSVADPTDTSPLGIRIGELVPVLWQAVRELDARLTALETP